MTRVRRFPIFRVLKKIVVKMISGVTLKYTRIHATNGIARLRIFDLTSEGEYRKRKYFFLTR